MNKKFKIGYKNLQINKIHYFAYGGLIKNEDYNFLNLTLKGNIYNKLLADIKTYQNRDKYIKLENEITTKV